MTVRPRYAVVGCGECGQHWLLDRHREEAVSTCSRCQSNYLTRNLRARAEAHRYEAAAELRARILADRAGHADHYAEEPDWGVAREQIETAIDENHELLAEEAEASLGWGDDWFAEEADRCLGEQEKRYGELVETSRDRWRDLFATEAKEFQFRRYGRGVHEDIDEEQSSALHEHAHADHVSISGQGKLSPDVEIGPDGCTSPRALQEVIWDGERTVLADALLEAVEELVGDLDRPDRVDALVDAGVSALTTSVPGSSDSHEYARLAANGIDSNVERDRLLAVTSQLGGPTSTGHKSFLRDVVYGPVEILASSTSTAPTLSVDLAGLRDLKTNQQRSVLSYLLGLTPGVNVHLIGSHITQRVIIREFDDLLPVSVTERAKSRLHGSQSTRSTTEESRRLAREVLEERGIRHIDWRRLERIRQAPGERLSYDGLETDLLCDFGSRDAVKQFARRMREHDLLTAEGSSQDRHVRLTSVAVALLDIHPSLGPEAAAARSHGGRGPTDVEQSPADSESQPWRTTVSDPPNNNQGPCTPNARGTDPAPDRPRGEAEATVSGRSTASPAAVRFLSLADHHRAAAAAPTDGGVALEDRPLGPVDDRRAVSWSLDDDRDEVVVSVVASPVQAITAVRLCSALLNSKAEKEVLNPDNLRGEPAKWGLEGFAVTNPYVLRRGATLGWLRDVDADGGAFLGRLRRARNDLLEDLDDLADDGAYKDPGRLRDLLRQAHGLMGVLVRVYDLLGYDIVRELRLPEPSGYDLDNLAEFVTRASAISGRYGVYTAYRTLYEDREDKREDALGAPDVDVDDPTGTAAGSWTIVGPGVDQLAEVLEDVPDRLDLQEDAENFAEFALPHHVVDGSRREAYAQLLARLLPFKSLESTREALGVLRALTGSMYDAATAVARLGAGDGREVDHGDLQHALACLVDDLGADRLLPDLAGSTVSAVVAALLQQREPLTTAEVAEAADVSRQSIRDNRDRLEELEALGLLDVQEGGAGEANRWSFGLPGSDFGGSRAVKPSFPGSTPGFVPVEPGSGSPEWWLSDAFFELLSRIGHLEHVPDLAGPEAMTAFGGIPPDRDLGPLLETGRLKQLAQLLAQLLDVADQLPDEGRFGGSLTSSVELGVRPDRPGRQASLEAVG